MFTLPHPFSSIPREPLLYPHPSPISSLPRLTTFLSPSTPHTTYHIKREDTNSGLAFGGGNKIRKLEYVLPDALSQNATTLVTTGGLQSNHMRQTAAVAAKLGLKCHLIPNDRVKGMKAEYSSLGNIQINRLLGAESEGEYDVDKDVVMERLKQRGEVPYWIPAGASLHPLGGLGYARFTFEVVAQENEIGVFFDTIILPAGSGSTVAGMIAGFKLISSWEEEGGKERRIIGVDVGAYPVEKVRPQILSIARNTAKLIGLEESEVGEKDLVIDDRFSAGKYGVVNEETKEAVKRLASLEGILIDPVYTGKAMAGLIGMAKMGELKGCKNILFVHTGGVPALSAYPDVV